MEAQSTLFEREGRFADRRDAGRRLARTLAPLEDERPVVLALPRGGVPVAYEVAAFLHAPLDVLFVRKIGAPGHPELGLGAVVDGKHPQRILNDSIVEAVRPSPAYLEAEERRQLDVIEARKQRLRGAHPEQDVEGRTVILVDDGIATGGTVRAALQALARVGARRTVLAVPVAPADVLLRLPVDARDFVCLLLPPDLQAVGMYYADFSQTTEDEVVELLERARAGFGDAMNTPRDRAADAGGTAWQRG